MPPNVYFYGNNDLPLPQTYIRTVFCITLVCIIWLGGTPALANDAGNADTTPLSNKKAALAFLEKQKGLKESKYWLNVDPVLFLQNLKNNIENPLGLYEGRSTNFCAYAALSYLPLHYDPLSYTIFMIELYKNGKALYGKEYFEPSREVKLAAGTLTFKGELDVRPADQLWFMALADHFKGYLNFFDKNYNSGDENKLWASVNFSKFNRMVRRLFNYRVVAVGSDLFRPGIRDIYEYLSNRLQKGTVALFVNNLDLYKKNHTRLKIDVPTHFIILLDVEEVEDDKIAVTYWDYGFRSRQILSPKFLKKLIFGIAVCTKKTSNDR